MLCDELVEEIAAFTTVAFSGRILPELFSALHTSANLLMLGQMSRPVASSDVLRRIIGTVFCRRYGKKLPDFFQPWGKYDVAVSNRVEVMALMEIILPVVPDAANLFTREPPKPHSTLEGVNLAVIESVRSVQQGCNHGPLCFSAGALKMLKEFKSQPLVLGASVVSFIDDITFILLTEHSLDMAPIGTVI